jgi:hypothetical protein
LTPEAGAGLAAEIRQTITHAAEAEVKRALAARAQLHAIARLAQRLGLTVVVLKGGVPVARGTNLHLVDIDVLVPPAQADALAAALESEGFTAAGWSSPRHLSARVASGALPVEIHTTTHRAGKPLPERVWDEIHRIENEPDLHRLSAPEHLWHVLSHIVVDHPYRRGRIRDLIVIADAVTLCSKSQIATVIERGAVSPHADTYEALVTAAHALRTGLAASDAFEAEALEHYAATDWMTRRPVPYALRETVWKWAFALLSGRAELHEVWADTVAVSLAPSPHGVVSQLERRAPRLGRAWRLAMRFLRLSLALPIAATIALAVRYELHSWDHDDQHE